MALFGWKPYMHNPRLKNWLHRIDKAVLSRWLGIPIFLLAMYLMFMFTINIGGLCVTYGIPDPVWK